MKKILMGLLTIAFLSVLTACSQTPDGGSRDSSGNPVIATNYVLSSVATNSLGTNGLTILTNTVYNIPPTYFSNFIISNAASYPFKIITISNAQTNSVDLFSITNYSYFTNYSGASTNFLNVITVSFQLFSSITNHTTNFTTNMFLQNESNFMVSNLIISNKGRDITNAMTNLVVIYKTTNNYTIDVSAFSLTNWCPIWHVLGYADFSDGQAEFVSLSLYIGIPYVAYYDHANGNKATVMMYNGSSWNSIGNKGFSDGSPNCLSFATYNGTPYVGYCDVSNGTGLGLSIMTYNGASWNYVGTRAFAEGYTGCSIAFDSGTPYVAFSDDGNTCKATVMKYNGSYWTNVGNPGFTIPSATPILAIYSSTPYIAYVSNSQFGNKASVMMYNGSSWVYVGSPDFTLGTANLDFAIDNGTLYLAYAETNTYLVTVMKYNGSSWTNVGNPRFSSTFLNSSFKLAFYNGTPYLNTGLSIMKFDGSSWTNAFGPNFPGGGGFAIYNGTPYVAFALEATVMIYK